MTLRFAPVAGPPTRGEGDLDAAVTAQRTRRLAASAAPALLAEGRARDSLRLLRDGGALAVTTGQQAGLFTGPLYSVYKALTAAALAEALTEARGTPVVPVFWVAGDDHDFAEINHCDVLGADGRASRIVLRERAPDAPMLPAYRETVGREGEAALRTMESLLPPSEFRAETIAWLARAYEPGHSMADAYALALADLLGPYGVVVCRGWHTAIKAVARPAFLAALSHAGEIDRELAAATERLRAAGRDVPVVVGDGLSLLMLEGRLGRDRLRIDGVGRFVTRRGGETLTLGELVDIAASAPGRLSGNVLLRPAIESQVFPTVAYVGGPGEMAYLAQSGPVFSILGVPRPARMLRLSGFLIEAKVDRVLERHRLAPESLGRAEGELASALGRDALPAAAVEALGGLRVALGERYGALLAVAAQIDRTLEKPVESARNQSLAATHEIEKKLIAHLKRHNETVLQQVARAREQLFPEGKPQERVLTVASYLSRHGTAVLDVIHEAARAHARRLLEAPSPQT
ncbi:MAG: bacillithiol biosynthesis cysteine-adding enzyme BshC [Gemmatimonadetes bacterium]|nr:bacillithiol biosynthesis cysteine-adding enzyme BshC [Gemmatimonadota bacterium]